MANIVPMQYEQRQSCRAKLLSYQLLTLTPSTLCTPLHSQSTTAMPGLRTQQHRISVNGWLHIVPSNSDPPLDLTSSTKLYPLPHSSDLKNKKYVPKLDPLARNQSKLDHVSCFWPVAAIPQINTLGGSHPGSKHLPAAWKLGIRQQKPQKVLEVGVWIQEQQGWLVALAAHRPHTRGCFFFSFDQTLRRASPR